jgi:5'-3' exonuclease
MGFQNVFLEKGYESDDLIAALVDSDMANSSMLQVTIVTSDHDMFQLLSSRTSLYLLGKRKMYTLQDFQAEWGISPSQWVDVKSIAGCSSDNIIGIDGVGEISAAKYMRGQLKSSSRVYRKIVEKAHTWRRNYDLVRLPYVGCPKIQAVPEKSWTFKTRLKGVRNRGKAKRK